VWWPRVLSVGAQDPEQLLGEHHVAVLAPLRLLDKDDNRSAIDIANIQRNDLGHGRAAA